MKKIKENKIVLLLVCGSILFALLFNMFGVKSYSRINNENISYVKGKVVEIIDQNIEYDETLEIDLGKQVLSVKLISGEQKGEVVQVENYLTQYNSVKAKVNTNLIISVDAPENITPYYSVYSYDRSFSMMVCCIVLMSAIILIGKGKGVKAIGGLLYSLFLIVYILLPTIFSGYSSILMSVVVAILSTAVTLLLLNGESDKTYAAIISTSLGVFLSLFFFMIASSLLHINGFSTSEAEGLILISQSTGLKIKDVLFAAVLISSLGAIMDVGMSIVSALFEVYHHNSSLTGKQLFTSGIEIGKDMIGTMSNTLILAFAGSQFVTLLVFISYQVQLNQLLNSNYLVIELAQGVCGTFGIVLTVPLASLVSAFYLSKKENSI